MRTIIAIASFIAAIVIILTNIGCIGRTEPLGPMENVWGERPDTPNTDNPVIDPVDAGTIVIDTPDGSLPMGVTDAGSMSQPDAGQPPTIVDGLTVRKDTSIDLATLYVAGTNNAGIMVIAVGSTRGRAELRELTFTSRGVMAFRAVRLRDMQSDRVIGEVFAPSGPRVTIPVNPESVVVAEGEEPRLIMLSVDLVDICSECEFTVGAQPIGFEIASAADVTGVAEDGTVSQVSQLSPLPVSDIAYMVRAMPDFQRVVVPEVPLHPANSVFSFTLSAVGGPIYIGYLTLRVETTGSIRVRNVRIIGSNGTNAFVIASRSADLTTGEGIFGMAVQPALRIDPSSIITNQVLLTTENGQAGDSVTVTMLGDDRVVEHLPSFYGEVMDDANSDFVWSDCSVSECPLDGNPINAVDWMNGYGVRGLAREETEGQTLFY